MDVLNKLEINLYGLGIKMRLLDAVEKYKPETMILNFGTFSTAWISEETFIEKANTTSENKINITLDITMVI